MTTIRAYKTACKAVRAWLVPACLLLALFASPATAGEVEVDPARDIYDFADILTAEEEARLASLAHSYREKNGMSYGILTVKNIGGKSPMEYADDFYDENLLGVGAGHDGLLLLIDMGGRNIWITTHGKAIKELTDKELDSGIEVVSGYLGKGKYYDGCQAFLDRIAALSVPPRAMTHTEQMRFGGMLSLVVGIVVGAIVAAVHLVRHYLARGRRAAAEVYMPAGTTNIADLGSTLVRSYVTSSRISESSSGSRGGGTSTHRSSSGSSHGGRGGKF